MSRSYRTDVPRFDFIREAFGGPGRVMVVPELLPRMNALRERAGLPPWKRTTLQSTLQMMAASGDVIRVPGYGPGKGSKQWMAFCLRPVWGNAGDGEWYATDAYTVVGMRHGEVGRCEKVPCARTCLSSDGLCTYGRLDPGS